MPAKPEQIRIAILDDYQKAALSMADWSALDLSLFGIKGCVEVGLARSEPVGLRG
jgi:hypothetical protein